MPMPRSPHRCDEKTRADPPAGSRRTVAPRRMNGQTRASIRTFRAICSMHTQTLITPLICIHPLSGEKGLDREAHISTKDASPCPGARLSRAHEDDRRPKGPVGASCEEAQAHHRRLISGHVVRAARLRRSGDIEKLRAEGRSLRRPAFSARLRPNDLAETRLAVVAPRTVGRAVKRNRARRRVREAFQIAVKSRRSPVGLDVLVTARPEAVHAEFIALRDDAASVLSEVTP
jgi:ribonuclease P protein component